MTNTVIPANVVKHLLRGTSPALPEIIKPLPNTLGGAAIRGEVENALIDFVIFHD